MLLDAIVLCLALNIYFEARGEPVIGQQYVAHVTLNRSKRSGKDVCAVVYEPYQFSWTLKPYKIKNIQAWNEALYIAEKAVHSPDITKGAMFFHTVDINPPWSRNKTFITQIGRHRFYK